MPSMKSVAHAPEAASETRSRLISPKTASSSVSGRAAAKVWWRSALTRPLPACTISVPSCSVTPWLATSPVLTHSHSPRSASCSKSGRTRTKTRARALEPCSSAGPVDAATRVRHEATPLLYSFPLAMRRSLVSLDSPAPEAGAAGAAGPDSLAPFRLGNASSRLPCAGKASFSAATSASPSRLAGRIAASPIQLLVGTKPLHAGF